MRLIDANMLINEFDQTFLGNNPRGVIQATIESAPTIEERKKGKWITEIRHHKSAHEEFDYLYTYCSECRCHKRISWFDAKYCPNCGAWMQEEGEEK